MSEPALKCENNCTILNQMYTIKLFIAFKIRGLFSLFQLWGNLDFPEFLPKKFITSTIDLYQQPKLAMIFKLAC